ncbi:MAG: AbgT family transporter [Cyclobacteriaceae bacterium]|nr:AbgT family transporter [Cyclobacteriaceae bacterium]
MQKKWIEKFLDGIEKAGNRLPDPAILFLYLMLFVWALSLILSNFSYHEIDPRSGAPLEIKNLLQGTSMASFLSGMIKTFISFPPLGVVLLAMLGVGVAEYSGYINTGLKIVLRITPSSLITPMLILVGIISHTATDAGYALVIPLGGIIFMAAGRHPLAGIAAAFAGVSGGFSANFIPSGIDPLLQSYTQTAAQIIEPGMQVNPLNNWLFTSLSSIIIILTGWYVTDKIVEPRLSGVQVDENAGESEVKFDDILPAEKKAFWTATMVVVISLLLLYLWVYPSDSPLRAPDGKIATFDAPIIQSIVPLIFILAWLPGAIYGFMSGNFKNSKDLVQSMTKAMHAMSYYVVMAFFCALFIDAFISSNIGALLALKGANFLKSLALPSQVTIVGIIVLTALVNLLVGSASAKWALLSPVFVPMLMQLGISPDLTQAAYRVGDSVSNIITPLMPYFPLVVVFSQRYVKNTGIGTLVSMMLPYSFIFIIIWTIFLLLYWFLGIPLGLQSSYTFP